MPGSRWQLLGVPVVFGTALANPADLRAYLDQLHQTGSGALLAPAMLRVLRSKACRSAIMFGDTLAPPQRAGLLAALRRTRLWAQCAHGRPTVAPLVHVPTLRVLLERRRKALGQQRRTQEEHPSSGRKRLSAIGLRAVLAKLRRNRTA
ncbi:hypothetical protein GPECTOR_4g885 [Gonium pectorale]|uniref:Uncharacterized protein n=1 Tax=Gonium pectorale TaxID=33097 RepID=A0A150GYE0_GONPE|nr:hypothetical protein GPECTOR_4g885 [Gonium pectorale]|eukprot:KXZ54814.1 hypothetical protein GPECTOR_4g885 [Gonium pectorale]